MHPFYPVIVSPMFIISFYIYYVHVKTSFLQEISPYNSAFISWFVFVI